MPVFLLSDALSFPPPRLATGEGLLAVGGDLSTDRLLLAYRQGIFPWYEDGEPILWWSPDPRLILFPHEIHLSRSLRKILRLNIFEVTADRAFDKVIAECARVRTENGQGTWINSEMLAGYRRLHAEGYAHSVETWHQGRLVGGLYGVSLGGSFFGESMFTRVSNASKVALVALARHLLRYGFDLVDCQMTTRHMVRFGAREIPRSRFLRELEKSLCKPTLRGPWHLVKTPGGDITGRV
jgi:leucyl/phenylalanyl-tRNA--protein transferase